MNDGEITLCEGVLVGSLRRAVNRSVRSSGTIHDESVAARLGLRGAPVAGSVHMDLFPPLLGAAFGARCWTAGTLSLYFLNATLDREPVRAFVKQPHDSGDGQVDVWVEREDGLRVAEGTASVGRSREPSALMRRPPDRFASAKLRILAGIDAGDPMEAADVVCTPAAHAERVDIITEPLDIYRTSKYGGPVVTPAGYVELLFAAPVEAVSRRCQINGAIGLFGAIELRNVNGPLIVGRTYKVGGEIVAVGESPKTEYFWFESWADDLEGTRIASHRMLARYMKNSSVLYAE